MGFQEVEVNWNNPVHKLFHFFEKFTEKSEKKNINFVFSYLNHTQFEKLNPILKS